jgi:hypothetical protein
MKLIIMIFYDLYSHENVINLLIKCTCDRDLAFNILTWMLIYEHIIGWKYDWVVPQATTSRNGKTNKIGQIKFMGHFF